MIDRVFNIDRFCGNDRTVQVGGDQKSMGQEFANSDAFATCQVEKVFANVCLRPPQDSLDRSQIDGMVISFRSSGYNLKQVFAESAVYCMGD